MKSVKKETLFYIIFVGLIIVIFVWSMIVQIREFDPEIEKKYKTASKDLANIKAAMICYYCKNKRFPVSLHDLVPETILQLPIDPWGRKYILTSLDWRRKNSGVDVLSMGGDGKRGGKAWKGDIISRIDLAEIRCKESKLWENCNRLRKK